MRELVLYPNDILTTKCEEVKLPLSAEDKQLVDELYDYVRDPANHAVGLAAPQLGVAKRMFAVKFKYNGNIYCFKVVNPIVIPTNRAAYFVPGGESCLSEPDVNILVRRYKGIILMGYDALTNSYLRVPLTGYAAAVIQHEYDHLKGVLLHSYMKGE